MKITNIKGKQIILELNSEEGSILYHFYCAGESRLSSCARNNEVREFADKLFTLLDKAGVLI